MRGNTEPKEHDNIIADSSGVTVRNNTSPQHIESLKLNGFIKTVIVISLFVFIGISSYGMYIINVNVFSKKSINTKAVLEQYTLNANYPQDRDHILKMAEFAALFELEVAALERRHHQANISIIATIWVKFLSFLTGMILAVIGAVFILARINDMNVDLNVTDTKFGKLVFKSSSPGIFLVLTGFILILFSFSSKSTGEIKDAPAYLIYNRNAIGSSVSMPPSNVGQGATPQDTTGVDNDSLD